MRGIHTLGLPFWLRSDFIFSGAEGEGQTSGDGGTGGDGGTVDAGSTGDGASGDGGTGDSTGSTKDGRDTALEAERRARKAAEKRAKELERAAQETADKDKPEVARLTSENEQIKARTAALAEAFKKTALDRAIEKAASALNFADVDDALALVDRSKITVEQDEDEPQSVEVDAKTVQTAVKALADSKKHLLKTTNDGDGRATGSTMGGSSHGKSGETSSEEALKKRYRHL